MYQSGVYSLFDEISWATDAYSFTNSLYKIQKNLVSRGALSGYDVDYYQITLPYSGSFKITISNDSANSWGAGWTNNFVYADVVNSLGVTQSSLSTYAYSSLDGTLDFNSSAGYSTSFYLKVYGYSKANYVIKLTDSLAADTVAPTVLVFNPSDGATGVSTTSNIVVTFSEAILRGTGTIGLWDSSGGGAYVETFDMATSSRLTLSGSTLTIDPATTLTKNTIYFVVFAAGNIKDLSGNSYVGTSIYDFKTVAEVNQTLSGTSGSDTLLGGFGNDYIDGGGGDDSLDGDLGNDSIYGGAGSDHVLYLFSPSAVIVDLALGTASGGAGNDTLAQIEGVIGSNFNDHLSGDGNTNGLMGGGGDDTIDGRGGDDLLWGDAGNDILIGGDGNDTISYSSAVGAVNVNLSLGTTSGGAGNDTFSGIESVFGSTFADTIIGSETNDICYGDNGNDTIYGSAGNDVIYGGAGSDTLAGGTGNDIVSFKLATNSVTVDMLLGNASGAEGSDQLSEFEGVIGSSFDDVIDGDDHTNTLIAGAGNDSLNGRAGDDRVWGDAGNDKIDGGIGVDTAVYSGKISDYFISYNRALGSATVTDHRANSDGTDTLKSIEKLQFSDKTFDLINLPTTGTPGYGKIESFLFDAAYYLLKNPELVPTVTLATAYNSYKTVGAAAGDAPNAWFDPVYYANKWADLKPLNLDAATLFQHYNLYGVWEGRSAGPAFDHFDGTKYLNDNPDVAAYVDAYLADFLGSRSNGAIAHYVIYGANEGRAAFDTSGVVIEQAILIGTSSN